MKLHKVNFVTRLIFQAIVGLPSEFKASLLSLQENAEDCLENEKYPQFFLPDGSFRRTLAINEQNRERLDKII